MRKGLEALKVIYASGDDGAYGDLEKNLALLNVDNVPEIDLLTMYAVGLSIIPHAEFAEPDLTVVQQSLEFRVEDISVTYLRLFPENPSAFVFMNLPAAESLESQKRNGDDERQERIFEDLITVVSPRVLTVMENFLTPEYILENMCRYVYGDENLQEAFEEFEDSDALYGIVSSGDNPQIVFQKPKETVRILHGVFLESIIVKVAVGLGNRLGIGLVALSDVYSNPLSDPADETVREGRAAPMLDLVTLGMDYGYENRAMIDIYTDYAAVLTVNRQGLRPRFLFLFALV
ncbi:hypothetical protein SPFM12_00257 [Salmonella phage SPFM12]|nr:hypothetical protein SPFM12_00257 [Salmonella phage SPFM12]